MVGIFRPQKLANVTNLGLFPPTPCSARASCWPLVHLPVALVWAGPSAVLGWVFPSLESGVGWLLVFQLVFFPAACEAWWWVVLLLSYLKPGAQPVMRWLRVVPRAVPNCWASRTTYTSKRPSVVVGRLWSFEAVTLLTIFLWTLCSSPSKCSEHYHPSYLRIWSSFEHSCAPISLIIPSQTPMPPPL